jgi:hypothetical protein
MISKTPLKLSVAINKIIVPNWIKSRLLVKYLKSSFLVSAAKRYSDKVQKKNNI